MYYAHKIVALSRLSLHPEARRLHRETVDALKIDMTRNGQKMPIEVDRAFRILHGAQRWHAATELQWDGIASPERRPRHVVREESRR